MDAKKAILIGNGTMGKRHRARFEACGVRFVSVLDVDAMRSLDGFDWKAQPVDFAVVATPAKTHYEYVKFLLTHHIPVMVEKPLAVSASEVKELVDLSRQNSALLFVTQSECYNPLFLNFRKHFLADLKSAVAAVTSRRPLNVKLEFRREHGFSNRCRDVDVSLDLLIHDVSLFLNLFDAKDVAFEPESDGFAEETCGDRTVRHAKVVSGEFAGVTADFIADRNSNRDVRQISVAFGRNGSLPSFDYSVSLVSYTPAGDVRHIPDSLDNEHRFFLKLLAGACEPWAKRALMNAAQSVSLILDSKI